MSQSYCNLTIRVTGNGTSDPLAGTYTGIYLQGYDLLMTAYPASGWDYVGYNRNGTPIFDPSNPFDISNLGAVEVITVLFSAQVPPPTLYPLYLNVVYPNTQAGTTDPPPPRMPPPPQIVNTYLAGTTASISALPYSGYMFDHWLLDDGTTSTDNPLHVYMGSSRNVTVYFAPVTPPVGTPSITVSTDKTQYPLGSNVTVSGTVQADHTPQANTLVSIIITDPNGISTALYPTTDNNGNYSYLYMPTGTQGTYSTVAGALGVSATTSFIMVMPVTPPSGKGISAGAVVGVVVGLGVFAYVAYRLLKG